MITQSWSSILAQNPVNRGDYLQLQLKIGLLILSLKNVGKYTRSASIVRILFFFFLGGLLFVIASFWHETNLFDVTQRVSSEWNSTTLTNLPGGNNSRQVDNRNFTVYLSRSLLCTLIEKWSKGNWGTFFRWFWSLKVSVNHAEILAHRENSEFVRIIHFVVLLFSEFYGCFCEHKYAVYNVFLVLKATSHLLAKFSPILQHNDQHKNSEEQSLRNKSPFSHSSTIHLEKIQTRNQVLKEKHPVLQHHFASLSYCTYFTLSLTARRVADEIFNFVGTSCQRVPWVTSWARNFAVLHTTKRKMKTLVNN